MDAAWFIDRLEAFGPVPTALLATIDQTAAKWRPSEGEWSLVETVCHLVDEELEDFRMRLRLTIEDPAAEWPPIDPEGVAVERAYLERPLGVMLSQFAAVRRESVAWLRSLPEIDLAIQNVHPRFGSMQAGDLLASWCAHDALHLRQLAKRLHQLAELHGEPYCTQYAGKW